MDATRLQQCRATIQSDPHAQAAEIEPGLHRCQPHPGPPPFDAGGADRVTRLTQLGRPRRCAARSIESPRRQQRCDGSVEVTGCSGTKRLGEPERLAEPRMRPDELSSSVVVQFGQVA